MHRKAYAKLTLYLHVAGREGSLLHFKNITIPIDLFDIIYLEVSKEMKIQSNQSFLPNDKRNTVYKTINVMKNVYNLEENYHIKIVKNIPAQSGLGGGSADAAAVIHLLNDYHDLGMTDEEKINIARQIDEDTPFCLFNKPAVVSGDGSDLKFIESNLHFYYLMIKPGKGISTKRFMKRFKYTPHEKYGFEEMLNALKTNNYQSLIKYTHNDFKQGVAKRNMDLERALNDLKKYGCEGVSMTGTGSVVYGFSQDKRKVMEAHRELVMKYPFVKYGEISL